MLTLGDLTILADRLPPAKFLKALAVIAKYLHAQYDVQPWTAPGKSRDACVLCSLTVRDFLRRIGFGSASAIPVMAVIRAFDDAGEQVHSVGIGIPDTPPAHKRWCGHMVVIEPSIGWLVDVTLEQAKRPQWPWLPSMAVVPLWEGGARSIAFAASPRRIVAVAGPTDEPSGIVWLDNASNRIWRRGPDAQEWRRAVVTAELVARFHPWEDERDTQHGEATTAKSVPR